MRKKKEQPAYDPSLRPTLLPGQLGDWAAFIAVALFAALWLSWPSPPESVERKRPVPQTPSCSYGSVDVQSSSGSALRHFNSDYGADEKTPLVKMPEIALPTIPDSLENRFAAASPPEEDDDLRLLPAISYTLPPVEHPYEVSSVVSTGAVVTISPRLRAANYSLSVPDVTNSFSLTASVLFSDPLDLPNVIIDSFSGPDEVLAAWRKALLLSSASSKAAGTVTANR